MLKNERFSRVKLQMKLYTKNKMVNPSIDELQKQKGTDTKVNRFLFGIRPCFGQIF